MERNLCSVLYYAYHMSQDPRDLNKIDAILKKIADYEKDNPL